MLATNTSSANLFIFKSPYGAMETVSSIYFVLLLSKQDLRNFEHYPRPEREVV